jgi:hypothetical protein
MGRKLKKTTLDGGRAWEGFRGIAYYLDSDKVWKLPITTRSGEQTTVGEVFASLKEAKSFELESPNFESPIVYLIVKTTAGEIRYEGSSFNLNVLNVLLNLHKMDMAPFAATFFYYDSHSSRKEPLDIYNFFIVCDKKIVEGSLEFRDYPGSGFDPSVFLANDGDEPWEQAWVRFCYRKFYTETEFGQLMALRPDRPELYYYRSGTTPFALRPVQTQLDQIRWLLIILIVIGIVLAYLTSR